MMTYAQARRRWFVVTGVAVLAASLGVGLGIAINANAAPNGSNTPEPASLTIAGTAVQPTSVAIDPRLWTYGSPPANTATPALTAQQDFDQYTGLTAFPSDTTVTIGTLTSKTLDGEVAQTTLVYGYSDYEPQCPDFGPGGPTDANGCTGWTFLDANTGKQILTTWTLN